MNLRAYLSLLRPWRALLLGLFNSFCFGLVFLQNFGGCSTQDALALTCVIVGPLVFGDLLAGPIHEFMNCSIFPLLPNARRRLRRWYLHGLLALVALFLVSACAFAPEFPMAARLGLIVAGLSIPLLNSRRTTKSYAILLLITVPFFAPTLRAAFVAFCQGHPWAVLLTGILCALLCIRHIFSAIFAHNFWHAPYVASVQTLAPLLNTTMLQRLRQENVRQAASKKSRPSRNWLGGVVGTSLYDWTRVVRHARFGGGEWTWSVPGTIAFGAFASCTYIILPLAFGLFEKGLKTPLPTLCRQLLDSARGIEVDGSLFHLAFQSLPFTAIMITMFAASVSAVPATRFPLSRCRLADCLFAETARAGALGCLGFALANLSVIAGAAICIHAPLEAGLFTRALGHILALPIVILLNIATVYASVRFRWVASVGGYLAWAAVGGAIGGVAMVVAEKTDHRLGLGLWLPSFVLAAWLCRAAFRRYYAANDLNRLMPWAARFTGRAA